MASGRVSGTEGYTEEAEALVKQDLRHLQPGRHDGSSGRLSHLQLEPVERALRAADRGGRDPGVTRRGRQVVVAEQHLNGTDVGAGFEQMSGEAVPQRVQIPGSVPSIGTTPT